MLQKEVAQRICETRIKTYGILSVLIQAFISRMLFSVSNKIIFSASKGAFRVVRLKKSKNRLDCYGVFPGCQSLFNQRRQTLKFCQISV
jgi:16S rRNA A1518/A1519 N6-dimethyltransferase RsmA/KsgA/DIM1 with predicted DNA glycosylase/AP lyase activity